MLLEQVAAVEKCYAESVIPLMRPEQQLVVVIGLFADQNFTLAGNLSQQEPALLAKLQAYWECPLKLYLGLSTNKLSTL